MNAPTFLCRLDDIPSPGAKGVVLGEGGDGGGVIVVRAGATVRAFRNSCPHQGTPLETFPDRFLDPSGQHLVCSTHGARFRVTDGHCVWGPCQGANLEPLDIEVENGEVRLVGRPLHAGDA